MSLFKKRKNLNIRQRRDEDEEENDRESLSIDRHKEFKPTSKSSDHPKEKKRNKEKHDKKTVLSFEDELEADDGIIFQEKKSSLSYRLRKEMKKERKEKKKEEKLKIEGKDRNKPSNTTLSELDELGIKIVNGREAEFLDYQSGDSGEEDKKNPKHIFRPKKKEDSPIEPWKDVLQGGKIPDANLIHQIRKQRQKARERDAAGPEDVIKLEDNKSRLIREEDHDLSDDEERVKFHVNQDEVDRKQRREAFEAAQAERGESDHDTEWEMQQLKKAGAAAKLASDAVESMQQDSISDMNYQAPYYGNGLSGQSSYAGYIPGPTEVPWGTGGESFSQFSAPLPRLADYQAEGIIKRLRDSRASLDEVHRAHRLEGDEIIDRLVASKATILKCKADRDPQIHSFQFYQDLRGYVTDLRECLNEKFAKIKDEEKKIYNKYRERNDKIINRRRQDVIDQNNEVSPFIGDQPKSNDDEMRRRTRRSAEREGRRTRRRRERERKIDTKHHDGMSTDDEEPHSECNKRATEMNSIASDAKAIFDDVEEDFSLLNKALEKFEEWRNVEPASYNDAYVAFNLPKIMSPYIRLYLLLWNPLNKQEDTIDIERLSWFHQIFMYGINTDGGASSVETFKIDPDRRLASHIIEKVILPKLKELVSCAWDPLSHVQSVRLVNLVRHFASNYPTIKPASKQLVELTQAIISKIKDSIENDVFIPIFPRNVFENKNSGVSLFFQRQFWSAWKLLGSVLMWHRILNDSIIHDLAIQPLLYLITGINRAAELNINDALEKTRNVINVLPREWSKQEGGGTHSFLGRLEAFLVTMAEKLDPALHNLELREICNLLKSIGAKAQAENIDNKYL